jgi:MFS family permease
VGWAGPLLAGFSVAAALGAILYALRGSWPGSLRTQSVILLVGMTGCVALVATAPSVAWMAVALVLAGLMQAGVQLARNLSLRQALPSRAHAAGYSVLYAATGVGYAGSAILAGAVQRAASPEDAILAGAGLTLLLTAVSALAELTPRRRAPIRRAANPVIDCGDCASESRLRSGRRARSAAIGVQGSSQTAWACWVSLYSRTSRISPPRTRMRVWYSFW